MIVVRMVFQTKFGMSGQIASNFKESAAWMHETLGGDAAVRVRILTDLSGPFNTVIQELEMESLAKWEQNRAKLFASPRWHEMQAQMQATMPDAMESGHTEFYTLEYSG